MLTDLLSNTRHWSVSGHTVEGRPYTGRGVMKPDGEAFRMSWILSGDTGAFELSGVAFVLEETLYMARSTTRSPEAPDTFPGLVRYSIAIPGTLPARWYHPELQGKLGEGISTGGPTSQLCGNYKADYNDSEGQRPSLVKKISEASGKLHMHWFNGDVIEFGGVGFTSGDELVSAWSSPPRADLDVMRGTVIQGKSVGLQWRSYTEESDGWGSEELRPG